MSLFLSYNTFSYTRAFPLPHLALNTGDDTVDGSIPYISSTSHSGVLELLDIRNFVLISQCVLVRLFVNTKNTSSSVLHQNSHLNA